MPNEAMYNYVNVGTKIYRSKFNLSYENIFDCDFGVGVPVMARFCVPGDIWRIKNVGFFRTLPLFAPQFTGIKVKFRNFFVPLRLLNDDAEEIIIGVTKDLEPSNKSFSHDTRGRSKYSFYDYLGVSLGNGTDDSESQLANYWLKAYWLIYNEWYRDEHLENEVPIGVSSLSQSLFKVNYSRDYFTSALLTQQLGVAPAIPLNGVLPLIYSGSTSDIVTDGYGNPYTGLYPVVTSTNLQRNSNQGGEGQYYPKGYGVSVGFSNLSGSGVQAPLSLKTSGDTSAPIPNVGGSDNASLLAGGIPLTRNIGPDGATYSIPFSSDLSLAGGQFDVQDIRRAFAFQSVLERNNRAGSRYNEFLRANYGISPTDETLQRPVYLGGSQSYINISEVLQNSQTTDTSPLGTMGGRGIGLTSKSCSPYLVKEFGVIMSIMSITPDTMYNSQGVNRQYTYVSRWDFFNPSLQNLGEQAVRNGELYFKFGESDNDKIFGYQPMYQELRSSENIVAGAFRDNLRYWHLARNFDSRPNLNASFIEVSSTRDDLNRIFSASDGETFKPFYCHVYNDLSVIRPLVKYPIPATL